MIQKFWESIAKDIEQEEGTAPKTWKKNRIESHFLPKLSEKVTRLCLIDKHKAKLCNKRLNEPINTSYNTFRRYLQLPPTETGDARTRHIYAIYLGYKSCEAYCVEKGIPLLTKAISKETQINAQHQSKKEKNIKQVNFFSFFNRSSTKNLAGVKFQQINFFSFGNRQEVIIKED